MTLRRHLLDIHMMRDSERYVDSRTGFKRVDGLSGATSDMEETESHTPNPCPRALRAPPGGQPVGYARMARAIGDACNHIVTAEAEVGLARIAKRPPALVTGKIEQRAALRALDRG
jgi:hypothetical protein